MLEGVCVHPLARGGGGYLCQVGLNEVVGKSPLILHHFTLGFATQFPVRCHFKGWINSSDD